MQVTGLILDIFGAIFLFIGTELLNGLILKSLELLKHAVGIWNDDNSRVQIHDLEVKKKKASTYTSIGLILLILGFILQLIASIH